MTAERFKRNSEIYGFLLSADQQPRAGVPVIARLQHPNNEAIISRSGAIIGSTMSTLTDDAGRWTFTLLAPADLTNTDCYFEFFADGMSIAKTCSYEYSSSPIHVADVLESKVERAPIDIRRSNAKLYYTVVKLAADENIGTAFFFHYAHDQHHADYLVTNRHVVDNKVTFGFKMTRRKMGGPQIGITDELRFEYANDYWHFHPDASVDLAVMPLEVALQYLDVNYPGQHYYYHCIDMLSVVREWQVGHIEPISDVTFVGYPKGLADEVNALPIVRRGTTATPYQISYEGKPSFVIDAPVFPGSSGSPVFLPTKSSLFGTQVMLRQADYMFAGILSRWYYATDVDENGRPIKEPRDLGRVLRPELLYETIVSTLTP